MLRFFDACVVACIAAKAGIDWRAEIDAIRLQKSE